MSAVEKHKSGSPEATSAPGVLLADIGDWTDEEFRESFESLRIPNEWFRHREHIRLAWIYSTRFPAEEAVSRMIQGIRAFAKHHGAETKYHHTITLAWMQVVRHAVCSSPAALHFTSFLNLNPHLLNQRLLADYYSPELLNSEGARQDWRDPDRRPLP
jgi:N-formylglutamate deformylase